MTPTTPSPAAAPAAQTPGPAARVASAALALVAAATLGVTLWLVGQSHHVPAEARADARARAARSDAGADPESDPHAGGASAANSPGPGHPGGGMARAPAADVAAIDTLRTQVAAQPGDRALKLQLVKALLLKDPQEAAAVNDEVLKQAPDDSLANTYAGMILAAQGSVEAGAARIDGVLERDPNVADAWFFRGMVAMQAGDMARTRESWERYVTVAPDSDPRKARMKAMVERMAASAAGVEP